MTDSMKFGPEWLRNMSAEPSVVSSNSVSAVGAGGGSAGGLNSTLSLHSLSGGHSGGGSNLLASQSHSSASRNLFPEYRYGREEMLSLFDRNCLLPQILPSFKKLFVDKVQYPLALTPSSEDDMNTQSPIGSSSRPAWLQRSVGGFGIPSRGSARGGTVDRGRMRGKSIYHPIYQRPGALYDDSLSAAPIKPERNWSERNGIGDSTAVGIPTGGSSVAGVDWNATPSSSPRKEFSSHNRNMENWRRNRNEDGSGDGPTTGNIAGVEVAGWRSGGTHRWGRSTSWRDEEAMQGSNLDGAGFAGNTTANVQRSISAIGTVSTERAGANAKNPGSGTTAAANRQVSSKSWTGSNLKTTTGADGDDNLPEWAMENPSEMGGTFDASGAFHGESAESEFYGPIKKNVTNPRKQDEGEDVLASSENVSFGTKDKTLALTSNNLNNSCRVIPLQNQNTDSDSNAFVKPESLEKEAKTTEITITSNNNFNEQEDEAITITPESTPKHKSAVLGDISERFKEVANEVEKLIMDDDGGDCAKILVDDITSETTTTTSIVDSSRYVMPGQLNSAVNAGHIKQQNQQLINRHPDTSAELSHKSMPFSEQLMTIQHHQHHLQQQQQHLSIPLPPHLINANPNELWFYRDPQSNVQGPFSAMEMTEWYRAGYFNENLFVRRFSDSRFRPLGELIKLCHGNMPFTHSHLLPTPMDLDNLQITLTPRKPTAINLPFSLGEHHQHGSGIGIDEQLKASVTAAADSLSAAVKGHISAHTMDTSHMLTMRFQMLQDQYLQHQEYQILSELSKNECFQRLDAAQREAIVRSKVQMLVLPEYLSSFSGLSNSLAALNPIAGSQLYDAIAQQTKKGQQQQQIFPGNVDPRPAGIFLDANNFIINAQLMHQQTQKQNQPPEQGLQIGSDQETNNLNELPSTNIDLLNEYNLRMLLRGSSTTNSQLHQQSSLVKPNSGVDFMTESQLLSSQMMPIWPPNLQQQQATQPWPVMPSAKVNLWDVATIEEEQNQQLLLQQQQKRHLVSPDNTSSTIHLDFDASSQQDSDQQRKSEEELSASIIQDQRTQQTIVKGQPLTSEVTVQRKDQQSTQKNQQNHNQSSFKQVNKQQQPVHKQPQGKQIEMKINEEDRRREQAEDKKRLKEERKRQQQEDEKRRAMMVEEEKNRQQQEDKERQQQIQAQRRKALLGNQQTTAGVTATHTTGSGIKQSGVKIDQQTARSHATSIAPWSLQSPGVNTVAPGLAEIQKAERRERRADQQRQQEQLDKQMRANAAAAAEANDALVKWQASPAPAPVMSLVDIQAEEAKRLTNELIEQQRRREHEHHQQATVAANLTVSGPLSTIWGNANKAWSGSIINSSSVAASSGLWDEPTPTATPSKCVTLGTSTAASVLSTVVQQTANKQQSQLQVKTSAILPSPRNLRKSQTLPAMQSILTKNSKTTTVSSQQQQDKAKVVQNKTTTKAISGNEEKKSSLKSQQQSNDASSHSKISEYENEFTIWCMKSLDNMSAKVDVPTFVAFLQDLEAPYEVKDYVRIYLGEGKDSNDFVKQFLERRSKYKSLQRAQNAHNDDMCKPAPAITPSSNDNGENKNKQKKIKKNKMTKMDARILGFSVTAAEGRINVGSRDYVDGP